MGCQSVYSPPITIPTGLTGATGSAGASATDGASILLSGSGVSSSTGTQTIATCTGTLTGGTITAADTLEYEAYCKFTTSYIGTVYFKLGTQTILTHSIGANDIYTPPVGETEFVLLLKVRVKFVTTATETFVGSIEAVEDTVTKVVIPVDTAAEDSASNITMLLGCNPSAGVMTVSYFTVTKLNKV